MWIEYFRSNKKSPLPDGRGLFNNPNDQEQPDEVPQFRHL